ncbi:putative DNA binding domain-containing protein [Rhizobium sp. TH2]|uniref:RNA-binding domain-containing protein n=1 Tax=Rhizobium sp. TH2 TaxID=2775403 RepID=UPI002157C032|nr:RNA-binding domain-containing protein [Rhizobium sp. TH2]UVC09665.1 putative DNA binding domain-containing protein [Rhizobium sp. TH2]
MSYSGMAIADPVNLVITLCSHETETEWFEFKRGNFDAQEFGEYVSALANSAMLLGKRHAFLVYGVDDRTHEIVGTSVSLKAEKKNGEDFAIWLNQRLNPKINVTIETTYIDGKRVEIASIEPTYDRPVKFLNVAYIRIGQNKTNLDNAPAKERTLWALTNQHAFEKALAATHVGEADLTDKFHCKEFADIFYPTVMSQKNLVENLLGDGLIIDDLQGGYDVTNLFALLAAKNLGDFASVANKSPRVIVYKGREKTTATSDTTGKTGYAITFPKILSFVMGKVLGKEIFVTGVRKRETLYPEIAVREFIANALIHQDLLATGSRPTIEIFSDRMVIHNLGKPFADPERIIDAPPRSRNETLAAFMRRAGHAEERGSGYTRALMAIETANQAPPLFQIIDESYVVTLFRTTDFAVMSKDDRIRACYQHAVLKKLRNDPMNNTSLRRRLGLKDTQASQISNVIRDAQDTGLIKPLDKDQGYRVARYLPWWA